MKNLIKITTIAILLIFVSFGYKAYANDPELDFEIQNDFFSDCSDDGIYKLFPTTNQWNFIQLNTRNGMMSMVQFDIEGANRFTTELSWEILVSEEEEENGRFTLYPTKNMWTFILLDQIDGRTWQVQWGIERSDRLMIRIY